MKIGVLRGENLEGLPQPPSGMAGKMVGEETTSPHTAQATAVGQGDISRCFLVDTYMNKINVDMSSKHSINKTKQLFRNKSQFKSKKILKHLSRVSISCHRRGICINYTS
jgi:hypothetical protein